MRLLLIEDEPKTIAYLKKVLVENGFILDSADNGEEGKFLAVTRHYDLIILDVMLPKMDGWTIITRLRQRNIKTPVLFLTARDSIQERVKGLESGADDYLIKPFAFSELLARIRTILRRGQATSPIESSLEEFSRISRMINNLLFLARAENPQTAITYSPVDIDQLIHNIRDFYLAAAEEKEIMIDCQNSHLHVNADRQLLGQALSNLVANALQHTPQGGMITLAAHLTPDQEIQISVKDTGRGILPKHLPYLFDRFYRVDKARSLQTGGAGLGLSIVKSIMDLHRGRVKITSQANKGTTVICTFCA